MVKGIGRSQMQIYRFHIFIAFFLLSIFISLAKNSLSRDNNLIILPDEIYSNEAIEILSNQTNNNFPIQLIQPDSASQVTTFTPTFVWRTLKKRRPVEYRLLIAKIDERNSVSHSP